MGKLRPWQATDSAGLLNVEWASQTGWLAFGPLVSPKPKFKVASEEPHRGVSLYIAPQNGGVPLKVSLQNHQKRGTNSKTCDTTIPASGS